MSDRCPTSANAGISQVRFKIEKEIFDIITEVFRDIDDIPDCTVIYERRFKSISGFAEVKAECKKKDSLCTHQDLLRLSLFGTHAIEEYNAKCILLVQVIGPAITYYGCVEHTNGSKIIFEISKIKIPLSIQDFVMKL
ncbi:uncharacterized protein RHIMIDRAFT_290218 [Rhizopus microsporus ATCC 52813]|uniref:Uncharacterized protein n=1 Tax=Rhizopus microsporus ATCC 52813 TaxID=1340429 RepID=A0A2G4T1E3_RHIZD|nr:uncharacterized protein RHIMIDRAFT_290218 [Rhizopus microsporus ATCC 52813]PHZ14496.1 hypothetical protein RHIMIDRAFT_290218 [Rhizopus microsporus ATCC 52813]